MMEVLISKITMKMKKKSLYCDTHPQTLNRGCIDIYALKFLACGK